MSKIQQSFVALLIFLVDTSVSLSLKAMPKKSEFPYLKIWFQSTSNDCAFLLLSNNNGPYTPILDPSGMGFQGQFSVGFWLFSTSNRGSITKEVLPRFAITCTIVLVKNSVLSRNKLTKISESTLDTLKSLRLIANPSNAYFLFLFKKKHMATGVSILERKSMRYIKNKLIILYNQEQTNVELFSLCLHCRPKDYIEGTVSLGTRLGRLKDMFPDNLINLHGVKLIVSSGLPSNVITGIRQDPVTKQWSQARSLTKYSMDYLMDKYNFSAHYKIANLGQFGKKLQNGSWTGIISDLMTGRADMGSLLVQTYQRNLAVAFSFPITFSGLTFVTGRPKTHYSWRSIYWPFNFWMWNLTISSSFLVMFIFDKTLKLHAKMNGEPPNCHGAYYLFTVILEQDKRLISKETSVRIMVAFWLMFGIVINTGYRSKLVSLISFPVLEHLPSTFEELSKAASSNAIHVTLHDEGGPAMLYFRSSTYPTIRTLAENFDLLKNQTKCMEQSILSSRSTCIMWTVISNYVMLRYFATDRASNQQQPVEMQEEINIAPVGLVYQKDSLYTVKFDWALRAAVAFGIPETWKQMDADFLRQERGMQENFYGTQLEDEHQPLSTSNFIGAFYMFTVGHSLALTSLLIEMWKARKLFVISITNVIWDMNLVMCQF